MRRMSPLPRIFSLVLAAAVLSLAGPRAFAVTAVTNGIVLDPAPVSLLQGNAATTSNDVLFAIEEQTSVLLTSDLSVDVLPVNGVTYSQGNNPADTLLGSGIFVSSTIIHTDRTNSGFVSAVFTFDAPILALIWSDGKLNNTDALFGNAGTTYPTGITGRRMIDGEGTDQVTVVNGNELRLTMNAGATFLDQLRVITQAPPVPEPATAGLLAIGALSVVARRRRRKQTA